MGIETVGIPLAYAIVAALLLWLLLAAGVRWWLKAAAVFLCLFFALGLWSSLRSLQGWPVEGGMPRRFEIKWIVTEEPDKKTGRPGAVYVWAKDLDPSSAAKMPFFLRLGRGALSREPRIHKLPYSRPLHEQAEEIRRNLSAGRPFFGYLGKAGIGEGTPGAGGSGGGHPGKPGLADGGGEGGPALRGKGPSSLQAFVFYELPPPKLPEKRGLE